MFNKIKSAFSTFGKKAEEEAEETDSSEQVTEEKEKRGVVGFITKKKISEDKFSDLFEDFEEELLQSNEVLDLLKKNNVSMLGLFGSHVRNENNNKSDIDLLVKFSERTGLLSHVKLKRELSEILGMEVDLLTEKAISPYLRDNIMNDLKVIYND